MCSVSNAATGLQLPVFDTQTAAGLLPAEDSEDTEPVIKTVVKNTTVTHHPYISVSQNHSLLFHNGLTLSPTHILCLFSALLCPAPLLFFLPLTTLLSASLTSCPPFTLTFWSSLSLFLFLSLSHLSCAPFPPFIQPDLVTLLPSPPRRS